jgi:hypothetical protein
MIQENQGASTVETHQKPQAAHAQIPQLKTPLDDNHHGEGRTQQPITSVKA